MERQIGLIEVIIMILFICGLNYGNTPPNIFIIITFLVWMTSTTIRDYRNFRRTKKDETNKHIT